MGIFEGVGCEVWGEGEKMNTSIVSVISLVEMTRKMSYILSPHPAANQNLHNQPSWH